jgi:hypothetical protein
MSIKLTITLVVVSVLLIVLTTHFLRRGRIPEKYAILWYFFSLIMLIMSFFPGILSFIAKKLGFQLMSNMVILLLIGALFLLVMALTIMMAGQKKKTTMLIQEVSILKEKLDKESSKK